MNGITGDMGDMSTWVMIDPSSTAAAIPNQISPKFSLIHSVTRTVYRLPGL